MNVSIRSLSGNAVLAEIQGPADFYTAPEMKATLLRALEKGCRNLIVSFEKVTAIDASGLGVLIAILKRQHEIKGEMKIICSDSRIKETFQCTGLSKLFQILENEKEVDENLLAESFPCLDCPLFVGIPNCPVVKSFAFAAAPCRPAPHLEWLTRSYRRILQREPEKNKARKANYSLTLR